MVLEKILSKRASTASDVIGGAVGDIPGSVLGAIIPGAGLVNTIGPIHGLVASDIGRKDIRELDKTPGKAFIPGVGGSRITRRLRAVHNATGRDLGIVHNLLSPSANTVLAALIGAGVGAGVQALMGGTSAHDLTEGALTGAGIGAGASALGSLIGGLAAAATKKRTLAEQKATNTVDNTLAQYLVPGKGMYEYWKTLGASDNL